MSGSEEILILFIIDKARLDFRCNKLGFLEFRDASERVVAVRGARPQDDDILGTSIVIRPLEHALRGAIGFGVKDEKAAFRNGVFGTIGDGVAQQRIDNRARLSRANSAAHQNILAQHPSGKLKRCGGVNELKLAQSLIENGKVHPFFNGQAHEIMQSLADFFTR